MPDPPFHEDPDVTRLRRALALARLWLATFANPKSFVWNEGGEAPHQIAYTALAQVDAVASRRAPGKAEAARSAPGDAAASQAPGEATAGQAPGETTAAAPMAVGTGRMRRLSRGRAGFVEYHQDIARQALELGQVRAARAALRVLRTSDFGGQSRIAGALLDALRDNRASEEEVASAARALIQLTPRPITGSE